MQGDMSQTCFDVGVWLPALGLGTFLKHLLPKQTSYCLQKRLAWHGPSHPQTKANKSLDSLKNNTLIHLHTPGFDNIYLHYKL